MNVELMYSRRKSGNYFTLPSSHLLTAVLRRKQTTSIWSQVSGTANISTNEYYVTTTEEENRGPVPVIILTYMRSGSSFTGQILQAAPSTFYWFEPMHKLLVNFTPGNTFQFLNGVSRAFRSRDDVSTLTASSIASCHLDRLPVRVLTDGFLGHGNRDTSKSFISCLQSFRRLASDPKMPLRRCILDYKETCLKSNHVIIKTIRMTMASMEDMLVKHPRLKIVHLIRDPRATVRSQKTLGEFRDDKHENVTEKIISFCKRVLRDVLDREDFQRRFPNRIIPVFYEDIAKNPIEYSKTIYQFLGMEFSKESEEKIFQMTSSGTEQENCGVLCTNRPNSSVEANEWRHQVTIDFVKTVDKACAGLYNKLGYKTVPNKTSLFDLNYQLRNLQ
ncbi:Carbohydrate sulfotransferase 3 [Mizuhopecten yessoensis]|uniref:Carbohydrate sulfotransferase 3 n=1 Tax=Mizuhopecten yessoensis TaxID=6573 RepID=A0A210R198_MIZYE|nr:Carbohydrate sulfotransferase 3 [Mizuhopecten yessoensis]